MTISNSLNKLISREQLIVQNRISSFKKLHRDTKKGGKWKRLKGSRKGNKYILSIFIFIILKYAIFFSIKCKYNCCMLLRNFEIKQIKIVCPMAYTVWKLSTGHNI